MALAYNPANRENPDSKFALNELVYFTVKGQRVHGKIREVKDGKKYSVGPRVVNPLGNWIKSDENGGIWILKEEEITGGIGIEGGKRKFRKTRKSHKRRHSRRR